MKHKQYIKYAEIAQVKKGWSSSIIEFMGLERFIYLNLGWEYFMKQKQIIPELYPEYIKNLKNYILFKHKENSTADDALL